MPRPLAPLRVSTFLGASDAVPATIPEAGASAIENLYRKRSHLERRGGTSALGSGNLSPDQDLRHLSWQKITDTEHLLGVHNQNLVDFFASTVGATVANGTGKFTAATDVNAAWINGKVYL